MAAETEKVADNSQGDSQEIEEGLAVVKGEATNEMLHGSNDEDLLVNEADGDFAAGHLENDPSANGNHVEVDVNIHEEGVDDTGLYDDVMAVPTPNISGDFSADLNTEDAVKHEHSSDKPTQNSNHSQYSKRVSCYVGNLNWWTSDKDLSEAISSVGVSDLIEIKFYENKINGQSKGFAMVTVASDHSFRTLMDKLPKRPINNQDPVVTHFNRHYFNQFEEQARKDMPSSAGGGSDQQHNHHGANNTATNAQQNPQPLLMSMLTFSPFLFF